MSLQNHDVTANAATFSGAATSVVFWGLHLSDLAVMVSSVAAFCGMVIQVLNYLDRRASRRNSEGTKPNADTGS